MTKMMVKVAALNLIWQRDGELDKPTQQKLFIIAARSTHHHRMNHSHGRWREE